MAQERNNQRNNTDRIIEEIRQLNIYDLPYPRILEAIRQGADVSKLAQLRFPLFNVPRRMIREFPREYTLFIGAIVCRQYTLALEMVQQEQSVVEEKTPDNRNVLHYLFGNQRQKNPDALALLQTIVKINPSLLLEESEFGIRPLDHILQNYYQRNESLQTTSYFDFIVDTLEENKEDIDKPSQYDGHTYLITAASNNVPRHYITRLLEAGANIDGPDNKGMTPLMHACYMRRVENVRVLLEHGAEKDLQDKDGMTALMTAMAVGNYDIVRLLMEYNVPARTNIVSHNEFTAPNLGSSAIRKQFKQNYSRKKQSNRKNNSKNGMNKKKTRARTRK